MPPPQPTALYLFAHQDDEFGVMHQIEEDVGAGRRVLIAYFTTGTKGGISPARRNRESLNVLAHLGVSASDVMFAGEAEKIEDGSLADNLPKAVTWLKRLGRQCSDLQTVFMPAWEGGHPDHDALHAAAVIAFQETPSITLLQFPLYHGERCRAPWFKLMAPLAANGPATTTNIPAKRRFKHLGLMLRYPTQWKTWVGLYPFALWHYIRHGHQSLQTVIPNRITERPHRGALYYENRRFATWQQIHRAVTKVMQMPH